MTRAYIAGKYTSKDRLAVERDRLRLTGTNVVCRWMDQPEKTYDDWHGDPAVRSREQAAADLYELEQCNIFILDTLDESATGGREVELGYFVGLGMGEPSYNYGWQSVVLIGPMRNIFHHLIPNAQRYDSWEDYWKGITSQLT